MNIDGGEYDLAISIDRLHIGFTIGYAIAISVGGEEILYRHMRFI